jgi:hypothetical protein
MLDKTNQSGSGSIAEMWSPTYKPIKTFESVYLAADFVQYSAARTARSTLGSSVTFSVGLLLLMIAASSLVAYTVSDSTSKG